MRPHVRRNVAVLCAAALWCSLATAGASRTAIATTADAAAIKKAIGAARGHVVVVNFWATWCVPCVAEFPSLVRLHDHYAGRGLIVMSVSADQGSLYTKKVQPFLDTQNADFPSFILRSGDQQAAIDTFDRSWEGDLPRTFIYDKRGRLAKTLTGEQTYAEFVSAVKPLL